MLKKLVLNHKTIPVPVPIKTAAEALEWVATTFLRGDQVITKVLLDKRELDESRLETTRLDAQSRLEFLADSPEELAIQTLEALRNLACVVERQLKSLAVEAWEMPAGRTPKDADAVIGDMDLVMDLVAHFFELTPLTSEQTKAMAMYQPALQAVTKGLREARVRRDWKSFAKILLNELEPLIGDLISESGNLSALIFSLRIERPKSSLVSGR